MTKEYIQIESGHYLEGGRTIPDDMRNLERQAMQAELDAEPPTATKVDYVAPSQATIDAAQLIEDGKQYLAATDWYVTRKAEKGTEIPQAITDARDQARADANEV